MTTELTSIQDAAKQDAEMRMKTQALAAWCATGGKEEGFELAWPDLRKAISAAHMKDQGKPSKPATL